MQHRRTSRIIHHQNIVLSFSFSPGLWPDLPPPALTHAVTSVDPLPTRPLSTAPSGVTSHSSRCQPVSAFNPALSYRILLATPVCGVVPGGVQLSGVYCFCTSCVFSLYDILCEFASTTGIIRQFLHNAQIGSSRPGVLPVCGGGGWRRRNDGGALLHLVKGGAAGVHHVLVLAFGK